MADAQGTAGSVIKTISPALNAIPYVGSILSMVGTGVGGFLEADAAKKQAQQAEKIRTDALKMKPAGLDAKFQQKLIADKAAALEGLPGKQLWQKMLDEKTATDLRAIRESSPSGAAALTAASAALGRENNDLNTLAIKDAEFKAGLNKDARNTLWDLGLQSNRQEDIMNQKQGNALQAASGLDAAATYNKQGGINKIIGGITSTASSLSANAQQKQDNQQWMKFLQDYYLANGKLPDTGGAAANGVDINGAPVSMKPAEFGGNAFNPQLWNTGNYSLQLGQ